MIRSDYGRLVYELGDKVEWRNYLGTGRWVPATVIRIDTEWDDAGEYRWVVIELYNGLQRKLSHPEQKIFLRHAI